MCLRNLDLFSFIFDIASNRSPLDVKNSKQSLHVTHYPHSSKRWMNLPLSHFQVMERKENNLITLKETVILTADQNIGTQCIGGPPGDEIKASFLRMRRYWRHIESCFPAGRCLLTLELWITPWRKLLKLNNS